MHTKTLALILLVLTTTLVQAQAPVIQWQHALGGTEWDQATSILMLSETNMIVAGQTWSSDGDVPQAVNGMGDFWITKLDVTGTLVWQDSYGGSLHDSASEIRRTSDGGYILVGTTESNDGDVSGMHGIQDAWVLKLDATGSIEWQRALGGSSFELGHAIRELSDGGFIVGVNTTSNNGDVSGNHGNYDVWLVKLSAQGNLIWQKTFGGSQDDMCFSLLTTADGGYFCAGLTASNDGDVSGMHGGWDFWALKVDSTGNLLWQKPLGGPGLDEARAAVNTNDGGFVLTGFIESDGGDVTGHQGSRDYWVVKIDDQGNLLWQTTLGGSDYDIANAVTEGANGNVAVTGFSKSNDGDITQARGDFDSWTVMLDDLGNLLWEKSLGGSSYDRTFSMAFGQGSTLVLAGETRSNDGDVFGYHGTGTHPDMWVVTLVDSSANATPEEAILPVSLYPNPTTGLSSLRLPQIENGTIIVVDVHGKEVLRTTLQGIVQLVDLSGESSGTYFITVTTNSGIFRERIILHR